jgi:ribonuclease BN (tRNA processing enzyme)
MRLRFVGSADAFNSAGRGHSCYWLEGAFDGPLMIDFGATALMRLWQEQLDPRLLSAVIITHLHGDHFGGLPFLVIDSLYLRPRSSPLVLAGPVGFGARLRSLLEVVYGAAAPLDGLKHEIIEIAPGDELEIGGAKVRGYAAAHMDPPDYPLCLRVTDRSGKTVAFSGDSEPCDGMFAAADGADLFIAECTACAPPAGRHTTWEDWSRIYDRVRSKRLILSHVGADVRAKETEICAAAPAHLAVRVADDGMILDV